jgi:hypothetical protein
VTNSKADASIAGLIIRAGQNQIAQTCEARECFSLSAERLTEAGKLG